MSSSQLHQPLNAPSKNDLTKSQLSPISNKKDITFPNQGVDFSLGNNQPPSNINLSNNLPIPPNINNMNNPNNLNNINNLNNMNPNKLGGVGMPTNIPGGKPPTQPTTTNQQQANQQNTNAQTNQRNCKLFVMYLLIGLISLIGFIVSLIVFIKAGDFEKGIENLSKPPLSDIEFGFIFIYNPLSGLVFFLAIYLMYLSNTNDGKNINYSQTVTLVLSMLAFTFGVISYTQVPEMSTSNCGSACDFINIYSAYKQMVIPISLIPMLLLAGTQYILYRLRTAPPPPPPQPTPQKKDLELQRGDQKMNQGNLNKGPNMDLNHNLPGMPPSNLPNGNLTGNLAQKGPGINTFQNNRPSVLQTDPKFPIDSKQSQRGSNIPDNINMMGQNANNPFGNQDPNFQNPVQKFNNQGPVSGRSGSIVNNFGMPMYQPPKSNQIPLDDKEITTPREQTFQGIFTQNNQNTLGNLGLSQQMSTPTPNLGASSNQKLNQNNPFDNTPDIHNMKTTISQFTNTPVKSPTKGISPIDRAALSNNQGKNNENIPDLVSNTDYNPFGNTEKGEIQIGKHPYILGAKDPYVGKILDQVQVMVNNQVKSLLLDLKKQNKY